VNRRNDEVGAVTPWSLQRAEHELELKWVTQSAALACAGRRERAT